MIRTQPTPATVRSPPQTDEPKNYDKCHKKRVDSKVSRVYIGHNDVERCRSTVLYSKGEVMSMDGLGGFVAACGRVVEHSTFLLEFYV